MEKYLDIKVGSSVPDRHKHDLALEREIGLPNYLAQQVE